MESRLIHSASERLQYKVRWFRSVDTEYVYFGAGDEVDVDIVEQQLNKHFSEERLFVAWTRQGSFETRKALFIASAVTMLGSQNFFVWNASFDRVIEFTRIGVLRCGVVAT